MMARRRSSERDLFGLSLDGSDLFRLSFSRCFVGGPCGTNTQIDGGGFWIQSFGWYTWEWFTEVVETGTTELRNIRQGAEQWMRTKLTFWRTTVAFWHDYYGISVVGNGNDACDYGYTLVCFVFCCDNLSFLLFLLSSVSAQSDILRYFGVTFGVTFSGSNFRLSLLYFSWRQPPTEHQYLQPSFRALLREGTDGIVRLVNIWTASAGSLVRAVPRWSKLQDWISNKEVL